MDFDLRWTNGEEEKAKAYELRYELYVEDQGLFKDVADHKNRWLSDEYDRGSHIAIAEVGGEVAGTVRVTFGDAVSFGEETLLEYDMARFEGAVDDRDLGIITRLLVRKEYRGNGVLSFQLLWAAFERAAIRNLDLLLGCCEPHLVNRYRTLGFQPYGKLFNHPTSGALVPIAVVMGDIAHVRKIESPMVSALVARTRTHDEVEHIIPLMTHDLSIKSRGHDEETYWSDIFRWISDGERGILSELSQEESSVLLAKSHIIDCRPGDAIILTGHVSHTLYLLLEGTLEVRDGDRTVAWVKDIGDLVGEVAFFTKGQRMSDVLAGPEGARVLALSAGNLKKIIETYGPTAAKFLHHVATGLCEKLLERAQ